MVVTLRRAGARLACVVLFVAHLIRPARRGAELALVVYASFDAVAKQTVIAVLVAIIVIVIVVAIITAFGAACAQIIAGVLAQVLLSRRTRQRQRVPVRRVARRHVADGDHIVIG